MADDGYGRAIPSEFLNRMHAEFTAKYTEKGASAVEGGLNSTFGKQLKTMMEHATQFPGEYSKVANVAAKVGSMKARLGEFQLVSLLCSRATDYCGGDPPPSSHSSQHSIKGDRGRSCLEGGRRGVPLHL